MTPHAARDMSLSPNAQAERPRRADASQAVRSSLLFDGAPVLHASLPARVEVSNHPSHRALRGRFATLGAEEDDPHGEIVGEVLETMLRSRSHEQKIS